MRVCGVYADDRNPRWTMLPGRRAVTDRSPANLQGRARQGYPGYNPLRRGNAPGRRAGGSAEGKAKKVTA